MLQSRSKTCVALAVALVTASCATGPDGKPQGFEKTVKDTFASEDPCANNSRNIGIAGGALLGAVLAKATGTGKTGALVVGAGIGALLGGLIGADMDRRRCELIKVAKAYNLDIVMTDITVAPTAMGLINRGDQPASVGTAPASTSTSTAAAPTKKPEAVGMSLTIADRGQQFAVGSALPSPDAVKAFGAVADQYHVQASATDAAAVEAAQVRSRQMRILLIGHTDDTGSSARNADLSEERARAIAKIFAQRGFQADQIFYQGAGEVFPIASNETEEGRARNRRVEIVDLSDDAVFVAFLAARRPNVSNYRSAPEAKPKVELESGVWAPVAKSAELKKLPVKPPSVAAVSPTVTTAKAPVLAAAPPVGASAARPVAGLATTLVNIDLGGSPANGQFRNADIGKIGRSDSFIILSPAYAADEAPLRSCATDRPRVSRGVKSLDTGQVIKTSEYMPGTANASWAGKANGHLVGLTGVSVLRDGGQPASRPDLLIWTNFAEGSGARSDLKTTADVNAYQGDKALLYRVFVSEGPVRCIDLVIAKGAANTAPTSMIVYERNSTLYQADFSPTIVR